MLIPHILPDEFVLGYRGRIRILNGFPDTPRMMAALHPEGYCSDFNQSGTPAISVLAKAANVNCIQFVCRHSLIPFIRAVVMRDPHQAHGEPDGEQRLVRSGFRALREAAFFCPDCAAEDASFWGFPYWRRIHQIPGVDWCPKHGAPLVNGPAAEFDNLPPVDSPDVADHAPGDGSQNPVICRYVDIVQGLMELRTPLHSTEVTRMLGSAARNSGLRVSPTGRRPTLSDLALEQVPRSWLLRHFPNVARKEPFTYIRNFDGVCEPKHTAFSAKAYALAAALLYDSADKALYDLTVAPPPHHSTPSRKSKLIKDSGRSKQLMDAYVASKGSYSGVSNLLQTEGKHIAMILKNAGLPSLQAMQPALRVAIFQFLNGEALETVSCRHGIGLETVADAVRKACLPLLHALEKIQAVGPQT